MKQCAFFGSVWFAQVGKERVDGFGDLSPQLFLCLDLSSVDVVPAMLGVEDSCAKASEVDLGDAPETLRKGVGAVFDVRGVLARSGF